MKAATAPTSTPTVRAATPGSKTQRRKANLDAHKKGVRKHG